MFLNTKSKKLHMKTLYLAVTFFVALIFTWIVTGILVRADAKGQIYALKVSTGINSGADIGSFVITYRDSNKAVRRAYINPHDGDYKKSLDMVKASGEDNLSDRKKNIKDIFRYEVDLSKSADAGQALTSNSLNTFFFTTDYAVDEIISIGIMTGGSKTEGKKWSCFDLSLYRVDKIEGYVQCGFLSADSEIGFKGTLIETIGYETTGKNLTYEFSFGKNNLITLTHDKKDSTKVWLEKKNDPYDNTSTNSDNYTIKVDVADVYKAGFEAYVKDSKSNAKLSNINPAELLVLRIDYITETGALKTVNMPVIAASLCYAVEKGVITKDSSLADLLPQGGSLAFTAKLPGFREIHNAFIYYIAGEDKAYAGGSDLNLAGLTGLNIPSSANNVGLIIKHGDYYKAAAVDTISLSGVQIYEGSDAVNVTYENSTILRATANSDAKLIAYATASDREGYALKLGGSQKIDFAPAKGNNALTKPIDRRELYLIEVKTSTMLESKNVADVEASIKYLDNNDVEKEYKFSFMEAALPFYGYWPDASGHESGYKLLMKSGSKYHALVAIDSVNQIYGLTLNNNSDEAWLTEGVSIYKIENNAKIGGVYYKWNDKAGETGIIHGREVNGHLLEVSTSLKDEFSEDEKDITYAGGIGNSGDKTNEEENPDNPEDPDNPDKPHSDEKSYGVYVQGNSGKEISFYSDTISEAKDNRTNIFDYMFDMPYEIATTNFGFDSKRESYKVNVTVDSDPYGSIQNGIRYDDCGSSNFFYFQLIFEKGNSAYVQANQQLQSDSFRSGETESFNVYLNQDYGKLLSVNIIPEINESIGKPYDKLNIDKIEVIRTSGSGFTQTYETSGKLGWIGADFVDSGDKDKHPSEQLEKKFPIVREYNSAKIQFTMSYDSLPVNMEQFKGTVSAVITYKKTDGSLKTENVDVVKAMHTFDGTLSVAEESSYTSADGTQKLILSNPGLMFKPNHTDRFIWDFPDIKSIEQIELKFTNTAEKRVGVSLNCVELSLITKGDINKNRSMNVHGEYILEGKSTSINYSTVTKDIELDKGVSETIVVKFENDEASSITKLDDLINPYIVTKEPISGNDIVNIYAYVTDTSEDISDYKVTCDVDYSDHLNRDINTSNTLRYTKITDENGVEHQVYCCENLSVKNMGNLKNISLKATNGKSVDIAIDYIIIQHIRNNVVMGNYRADYTVPGVSIKNKLVPVQNIGKIENNQGYQEITIEIGDNLYDNEADRLAGKEKVLTKEKYDIAVSLAYKFAAGDTQTEYNTENIFLTDKGVESIKPGQIIKFRVYNANMGEITGMSVSTTGYLKADIKAITVGKYRPQSKAEDGSVSYECTNWYSIDSNRVLKNETVRFNVTDATFDGPNTLSTLTMNIKTMKSYAAEGGSIGTDVGLANGHNLSMIIYYEVNGALESYYIEDITKVLTSGDFSAGNTAEFSFMAKNMRPDNVKDVEFRPYDRDENTILVWGVDTIDLAFGDGSTSKKTLHVEPRRIMSERGGDNLISFAKVIISGKVEKVNATFDPEDKNRIASATLIQEFEKVTQLANKKIYIEKYSPKHVYRVYVNLENSNMGYSIDENASRGFKFYRTDEPNVIYFSIDAKVKEEKVLKLVSDENKDNFLEITFAIESNAEFDISATVDEVEAEFSAVDGTLVESEKVIKNLAVFGNSTPTQISINDYSISKIYKIAYTIDDENAEVLIKPDGGISIYRSVREEDKNILYCSIDGNVGEVKHIKIVPEDNEDNYLDVVFAIKAQSKFDISATVQEVSVAVDGQNIIADGLISEMGTVTGDSGTRFAIDEHTSDKIYKISVNIDKSSKGYIVDADNAFVKHQSANGCLYYSIDGTGGDVKKIRIISEENRDCYLDIIFDIKAVQVVIPSEEVESVEESKEE